MVCDVTDVLGLILAAAAMGVGVGAVLIEAWVARPLRRQLKALGVEPKA